MLKQVLINVEPTDMRVAILDDGILAELFVEAFDANRTLGNIYKGTVEGIIPGLKAAFVNIGMERNAFLHFSDILQEFELPTRGRPERLSPRGNKAQMERDEAEAAEGFDEDEFIPPPVMPDEDEIEAIDEADDGSKPKARAKKVKKPRRPLRVGDSILVQVTKEPLGEKGPRVTSYISIPGRYLVLMPFSERSGGVSRKIENPGERRRLRELLRSLESDEGSFIIRTAGLEQGDDEIKEDCEALRTKWAEIKKSGIRASSSSLIHNEQEILLRLVRDTLRNDIDEILIDSQVEMKKLLGACEKMAPNMVDRVHLVESGKNIFDVFKVEEQFQRALRPKVWLKSGGFLVIDETEAMAAIDVNSGKYVGTGDQNEVILKTNLEACEMVSRQLRLRDLGGLVVIDFIDMTNRSHQQQVLREFRSCLKRDNTKFSMTGFSEFGLVEMTRKRVRKSLSHSIFRMCPYCEGAGRVLTHAQIWKKIKYSLVDQLLQDPNIARIEIAVNSIIRTYLAKEVLGDIQAIAAQFEVKLDFTGNLDFHLEQFEVLNTDRSIVQAHNSKPGRRRAPAMKKDLESAEVAQDNPA